MPSADDNSPDGDETQDSPPNDSVQPSMTMHSVGYANMPMHMYPFPPGLGLVPPPPSLRSKRRQVKNACTNCQKACKKCDDARPCLRCVKYGIAEECVDSQRKERKKGIKRGPYKKRDGKGNTVEPIDMPTQQAIPIPNGLPVTSGSPPIGPYMGPVMYPPSFYGQYPTSGPKPVQGENPGYPPPSHFYSAPFLSSYPQPYQTFLLHRADGQGQLPNHHYAFTPHYSKPPSSGGSGELVGNIRMDSEDSGVEK